MKVTPEDRKLLQAQQKEAWEKIITSEYWRGVVFSSIFWMLLIGIILFT